MPNSWGYVLQVHVLINIVRAFSRASTPSRCLRKTVSNVLTLGILRRVKASSGCVEFLEKIHHPLIYELFVHHILAAGVVDR